jgi:hypothetical protein
MNMKRSAITFLIVFAAAVSICAQEVVQFNRGQLVRDGGDPLGNVNGAFRFQSSTSDITGKLSGAASSGIYTLCDFSGTPCAPGRTIRIREQMTGSSALRQDTAPIMINGVSYPVVFYFGQLTFDGGTIRIPYNVAKRKFFKLTVKGKVTGGITGFPHPASTQAIFGSNLNLTGAVTLEFRRKENGSPSPTYDLTNVTYAFPAP